MKNVVDTRKIKNISELESKSKMTVENARKLLGDDAKNITNVELENLIIATEQLARAMLRNSDVHKQALV